MSPRRNTLIITSEFPPLPGGIGNHALNLANYLSQNNIQVTVLADGRSSNDEDFDKKNDFITERTKLKRIRLFMYVSRIFKAFVLSKNTNNIILSGKFSIWLGGILSLVFKRNYIAVVHGTELNLNSILANKFTNYCLNRFTTIVSVSKYTQTFVLAERPNKLVINNGFFIKDDLDEVAEKEGNTLELITVGRLSRRKGCFNVLRVLKTLKKSYPKLTYHLVGIPEEKDRFLKEATELGVLENIRIHGLVSETDKVSLIKQSDIFCMLSEEGETGDIEGFGIAILEANSLGVPCLGSRHTGIEDAICNNMSGFLVDPHDEKEIVTKIKTLKSDLSYYSKESIKWSENFKWETVIKSYLKLLT